MSCSDVVGVPWERSTRIAYSKLLHEINTARTRPWTRPLSVTRPCTSRNHGRADGRVRTRPVCMAVHVDGPCTRPYTYTVTYTRVHRRVHVYTTEYTAVHVRVRAVYMALYGPCTRTTCVHGWYTAVDTNVDTAIVHEVQRPCDVYGRVHVYTARMRNLYNLQLCHKLL